MAAQNITLADQLGTAREQNVTQPFQASQQALAEAGATARSSAANANSVVVANIGAASSENVANITTKAEASVRAAQAREADARTSLTSAQTDKVNAITGIQTKIAEEYASPTPDQAKIRQYTNQVTAYSTDAQTQSAIMTSLASQSATAQLEMTRLTQERNSELNALSGIQYDDALKAQKQGNVDTLNQQIAVAKARADAYSNQAAAFSANRANMPAPTPVGSGNGSAGGPSATVPPPLAGPRVSAPASFMNATGSTPSGGTADITLPKLSVGAPGGAASATPSGATADIIAPVKAATTAPGAAPGSGTPTPAVPLPGTVGNATNLDVIRAARPDLNLDSLKGKSPAVVGLLMQIIDGRATLPPLGSRNPDAMMIRALAAEVDPTLDEASSKARMATRVDFTAGPEARAISALNLALGHAGLVNDNFTTLNNGSFPLKNWAGNAIITAWGDERPGNTQLAVNALASEARKVFAGANGGGSLAELEDWQKSFPVNGSLSQQRGALSQFVNLLDSRLQGLGDQYNRGMGVSGSPLTFLEPHAQEVFQRLTGNAPIAPTGNQLGNNPRPGATPPPAAAPAPANRQPASADLQRLWGQ